MPPLRAAVIGTGFIGPVHVEALRRAGVEARGILGSSAVRSQAAARALGIERAYSDLDELLGDEAVDAVHVTTPNRLHHEMVTRALRAGKHVLCEKPLAMDSRDSADLLRLARGSARACGVAYNVRFYPLCHEAAQRVRDGDIGRVLHVAGSYAQDWLVHEADFNWRVLAEEGGPLRAVADVGTHCLDLLQFITGLEIEALCADVMTAVPVRRRPRANVETFAGKERGAETATEPVEIDTDDWGGLLLRLRGGARGVVWVSQVAPGRKNSVRFEVTGSEGSLAWDSESPNRLWVGRRDRPNEELIRDPALVRPSARAWADYPGGHNEGYPDTFKQLFKAFYGYVAAGDFTATPPFPTFEDGHREILLCDAVLASHREGRWVEVTT